MKKLNNGGFTVVELLTSFTLASVVMILLTNILITIKEDYIRNKTEVEVEIQTSLLSDAFNEDAYHCSVDFYDEDSSTTAKAEYTVYFLASDSCDVSSAHVTLQNKTNASTGEENLIVTYTRTFLNDQTETVKYTFPSGTSFIDQDFTDRMAREPEYFLAEFKIKTRFPLSGDEQIQSMKTIYFYY